VNKPIKALVLYVLGVFAIGVFTAYPVSLLLPLLGATGAEFHSVLTRVLKLLAVLGLVPVLVYLGVNDRAHWGFGTTRNRFVRQVIVGLIIGALSMGVVAGALLLLGVRVDHTAVTFTFLEVVWLTVRISIAALIIGVIEEAWIRGALYSALDKALTAAGAVLVTAALFSIVHFLKGDASMDPSEPGWLSGVSVLASTLTELVRVENADSALALFIGGVFLALARYKTGSVAVCIGIHAGWVIVIKLTKAGTRLDHDSEWAWLAGNYDGFIGYLGATWLLVLVIAYYWRYVRTTQSTGKV